MALTTLIVRKEGRGYAYKTWNEHGRSGEGWVGEMETLFDVLVDRGGCEFCTSRSDVLLCSVGERSEQLPVCDYCREEQGLTAV